MHSTLKDNYYSLTNYIVDESWNIHYNLTISYCKLLTITPYYPFVHLENVRGDEALVIELKRR